MGAWDCECGYAGNGTCANPGCTLPGCTDQASCNHYNNLCDKTDYTKSAYNSANGACTASCNGSCDYFDNQNCGWKTASCNVPPASTIKGYKTLMPGTQSQNNPPSNVSPYNLTVQVDTNSTSNNPFSATVGSACAGAQNHTIFAPIPAGFSAGYTKCDSSTPATCPGNEIPPPGPLSIHSNIPTGAGDNTAGSGTINAIFPVSTPSQGSYADLWLHYCPSSNWVDSTTCAPVSGTCGPGYKPQKDSCGNNRNNVPCTVTCSFFQTFGGDVTFKGQLQNTQLPNPSYFVSNK